MGSLSEAISAIERADFPCAVAMLDSLTPATVEEIAAVLFYRTFCRESLGDSDHLALFGCYQRAAEDLTAPLLRSQALFRAGWMLVHLNDYHGAEPYFAGAVTLCCAVGIKTGIYSHAAYWQALCWETEGRYLDAIERYREIANLDEAFRAECFYRTIQCFVVVGALEAALSACGEAEACLAESSNPRDVEVRRMIGREREMLQTALETT